MADVDAELNELARRVVLAAEVAAEDPQAVGRYAQAANPRLIAGLVAALRELDYGLEAQRRDFISQGRLRDLADYISEGGQSDG